jgi:prepilin-type N-terminal cleavage/methylation domain-containing protein
MRVPTGAHRSFMLRKNGAAMPDLDRRFRLRVAAGVSLMECMVAVVVGSILLYAVYNCTSLMYTASTTNENQVLATNMAQQVIDNARDSRYDELNYQCNGDPTSGSTGTNSQVLNLYDYPTSDPNFFPRPLLRNLSTAAGMSYTTASTQQAFPGTVTETLTTLQPYDPDARTGSMKVSVLVAWTDSRGPHKYTTSTIISQTGIHNY